MHPFPRDFMFQISGDEWQNLKYQIGTSSSGHGGRRRPPYAFTEHGAIMAATVLNSPHCSAYRSRITRFALAPLALPFVVRRSEKSQSRLSIGKSFGYPFALEKLSRLRFLLLRA
jgi:hypothetical protein